MSAVASKPGSAAVAAQAPTTNTPSGRIFNFSAGPGCLPEEVIQQAQADLWNIAGSGVGILEHSHRAKVYDKVLAEAEADCRKIGNIPSNYKVLFLTGGATSQNFMVPANLLGQDETGEYLTTGYWAEKSAEQAKLYGTVHEAWDGRATKHSFIPSDAEIRYAGSGGGGGGASGGGKAPAYVHMCSNNTIYGTEWRVGEGATTQAASIRLPKVQDGVPLVCDMSSDLYCRPMDVSKFGLIYAGAQKNIGVAGTTLVVVREDLLNRNPRELPAMLQYRVHAKDESRHNTPPVFAIYFCGLVFKWIMKQGGTEAIFKRNVEKAQVIYDVLDSSKFYKGHARKDSRSLMNITFRVADDVKGGVKGAEELDARFIAEAGKQGMDQLKGHRATGGMRASVYNAFPRAGCEALAQFMREFEKKNG